MPIKSNIQTPLKNPQVASHNPSIFMGKLYSPEVYSVSSKGPAAAPISAMAIVLGVELMRPQNDLGFHEMTLSFKGFTTFKKNGVQAISQHHQPYSVNSRLLPKSSTKCPQKLILPGISRRWMSHSPGSATVSALASLVTEKILKGKLVGCDWCWKKDNQDSGCEEQIVE